MTPLEQLQAQWRADASKARSESSPLTGGFELTALIYGMCADALTPLIEVERMKDEELAELRTDQAFHRLATHSEQLEAAEQRLTVLTEKAQALVDKIGVIEMDGSFRAVWSMALIHGAKYTGPSWQSELSALADLLAGSPAPGEKNG